MAGASPDWIRLLKGSSSLERQLLEMLTKPAWLSVLEEPWPGKCLMTEIRPNSL